VNHVPQNLLSQCVVFGSNGVGVYEKEIVAGVVTVLLPTKCEVMQVICLTLLVGVCEGTMNNVSS
jgi:hypothetical protein